jgi:hypothetical protein
MAVLRSHRASLFCSAPTAGKRLDELCALAGQVRVVVSFATSRASASPNTCLTVCCMAITLLREDSVAWLVGSRSNSAWYTLIRNCPCFLRRSFVTVSGCSTTGILRWRRGLWEEFHRNVLLLNAENGQVVGAWMSRCFPQSIDLPEHDRPTQPNSPLEGP